MRTWMFLGWIVVACGACTEQPTTGDAGSDAQHEGTDGGTDAQQQADGGADGQGSPSGSTCTLESGRTCTDHGCTCDDLCNDCRCQPDGGVNQSVVGCRLDSSVDAGVCESASGPACRALTNGDATGGNSLYVCHAAGFQHRFYCAAGGTTCPGAGCVAAGSVPGETGTFWCCP